MKIRWLSGLLLLVAPSIAVLSEPDSSAPATAVMLGYSAQGALLQGQWERKFKDGISAANIRENMRRLSARPHHVGSPYDKDNAEWILSKFKEWGFDAKIETFDVLFPTPKIRVLEMLQPTRFRARLQEPPVAGDATSGQTAEQLPTYNAYSADGDVTAPLIYVNFGNRDDYEELDRLGVSVKGAIVIARYGEGWRGVKPKVAAEHGAIGCIIYSDPKGDGYFKGEEFPAGGWRSGNGVQRGSVMDTDYPGDPLTPGVGATANAKRLAIKDAKTITAIPVLPISYADALPLLSALKGPVAPEKWRGALAVTYHVGPGPALVHLKVTSNWDIKPIYDVIATLHGSAAADQWVIRGNHHDAWVNGAEDPISGQAAMLEEARMLGELHAHGWTPRRTIIYCAWDGEEPGLLGSVEWVETHLDELQKHAVAYINSDSNERGFLLPGGTQDLQNFISGVARGRRRSGDAFVVVSALASVQHPQGEECRGTQRSSQAQRSCRARARRRLRLHRFPRFRRNFHVESRVSETKTMAPSTTQSTTTFIGTPQFVDKDFAYGRALSQTGGTAIMRFADADFIPVDFSPQADAIEKYEAELEKLVKDKQDEFTERNLELKEGVFKATDDPRRPLLPPPAETVPPLSTWPP